ncbi:MAG TPA: aminotransferase class I/II-fold pyridoxal phosphate-dependent enzyme [Bacteroidales bacterium]
MLHGHGNDTDSCKDLIADFSSNVWHRGISKELTQILEKNIASITNYPEPDVKTLKNSIAGCFGIKGSNVVVTNGSTEAFYLIAHAFAKNKSVILYPSFAEYYDACKMYRHEIEQLPNSSGWLNIPFREQLVWLANPNNPDATTFSLNQIEDLLKANSSSIFIIDEAYIELCYNAESALPLLATYSNLIIVKSFTKAFSIPGLRLGYIVSSEDIINRIQQYLMPWSVNSLAAKAGIYITEHYSRLLPDKERIKEESVGLQSDLGKIAQLKVFPSACNFFLVQSLSKPASQLKEFLLEDSKILIRDASNFKGLDHSFFRVSVQSPEMNKLLIREIQKWTTQ